MLYLISFQCENIIIKEKVFQNVFTELRKYTKYKVNSYYDYKIIRIEYKNKIICNDLNSNNIIINLYANEEYIYDTNILNINYKIHSINTILVNIMLYLNNYKIIEGLYL
jgi:hypothetical protein